MWDVEGNEYIDFAAGIAVLNTGHRHPKVIAAIEKQLHAFTHTAYQIVPYEGYVALAERINQRVPIEWPAKTAFFSTGAEAVENAVKIARAYTRRPGLITFGGAFHGRTFMTMAMPGIQHGDPGGKINILVTFHVPHRGVFGFIGIEVTHDADTARRRL
ncbi:hypothetical protein A3N39_09715 [Enterobacter hormaechei subsp. steigerwaltii]|nr:hypothetical protein A3N39_09715 [Enterobacter hormaechei subsp. steigerwaltii]